MAVAVQNSATVNKWPKFRPVELSRIGRYI